MPLFFAIISVFSLLYATFSNNLSKLTKSLLSSSKEAIYTILAIIGVMMLWGGLMRIIKDSGLDLLISKVLSPCLRIIFKNLYSKGKSFKLISLNVTANLLGIGNAATPLGIMAIKELHKESSYSKAPSLNIKILTLLNTASIQLVPTTIASLRLNHSSSSPMEVLPCILVSSILSVIVGLFAVKAFHKVSTNESV